MWKCQCNSGTGLKLADTVPLCPVDTTISSSKQRNQNGILLQAIFASFHTAPSNFQWIVAS